MGERADEGKKATCTKRATDWRELRMKLPHTHTHTHMHATYRKSISLFAEAHHDQPRHKRSERMTKEHTEELMDLLKTANGTDMSHEELMDSMTNWMVAKGYTK